MAHCKHCGKPLRVIGSRPEGDVLDAEKMPVPFWLWFFPIPLFSAWFIRVEGPKFCGEACKREWHKLHPHGWVWPFIATHILPPVGLVVLGYFMMRQ